MRKGSKHRKSGSPVTLDDLEDPYKDRGKLRLELNNTERLDMRIRNVLNYFQEQECSLQDALSHFEYTETTRMVWDYCTKTGNITPFVQRIINRYLDIERSYTRREIAAELGVFYTTLVGIVESPEFQKEYNSHFYQMVQDPRVKAAKEAIGELMPQAYRALRDSLSDDAPPTVRLSAAKFLTERVDKLGLATADRAEYAEFLVSKGFERTNNLTIINNQTVVTIPEHYRLALQGQVTENLEIPAEVIEAEYSEEKV